MIRISSFIEFFNFLLNLSFATNFEIVPKRKGMNFHSNHYGYKKIPLVDFIF